MFCFKGNNQNLNGYKFGKTADGLPGFIPPGGADTVIPFSSAVYGEAVWENPYASSGGHSEVILGFKPRKLIGYTADTSNTNGGIGVEVLFYNIGENVDNIVHRHEVNTFSGYGGDSPQRLILTDTGFKMYNNGTLWRGCSFCYYAFR